MAVVSWNGTHAPYGLPEDYATFGTKTPALHGFRLVHLDSDHELVDIAVLVGGNSVDLTPTADLNRINILDGELDIQYQDANPGGEVFGYSVSHSTLSIHGARRYQMRDLGCVDECIRALPSQIFGGRLHLPTHDVLGGYILALTGFRLFFTGNRSHEVERIGVWFQDHDLHVVLRDHSGDDTFGYNVDFVVLPTAFLNTKVGSESGTGAKAFASVDLPTPPRSHFVLRGWQMRFTKGDQQLLDIGVLGSNNGFTVFYGDGGGGDSFDWRVDWAHIAPQVFAEAGAGTG